MGAGGIYFSPKNRLEREFSRGETFATEGQYDEAVISYRWVYEKEKEYPRSPEALFRSARIQTGYLKKHHEAILTCIEVGSNYPDTDYARKAYLLIAEIYKKELLDYQRAIVAYQRLLDAGMDSRDDILYQMADSYFHLGNFEQARIEFEGLLKSHPKSPLLPEVTYRIGISHALDGQLKKAKNRYRETIRSWPESPYATEAAFALANALEEDEELKNALDLLKSLENKYSRPLVIKNKIKRIKERIRKKKKAI